MGLSLNTLAAAKKFTKKTVKGAGALKGEPGKDGISVKSMAITSDNIVMATMSDDTTMQVGKLQTIAGDKGPKGDSGITPHIDDTTGRWFIGNVDTGFVAVPKSEISFYDLKDVPVIPIALSQLSNDAGFITRTIDNLLNYYCKNEIYTKDEVSDLVGNLNRLTVSIVEQLPTKNISNTTIYLTSSGNSIYTQHMYIANAWANLGTTNIDLDEYVKIKDLESELIKKASSDHIHEELHQHNNKVLLDTITSDMINKWNSKFSGNYNDLTNTPTIPIVSNDLTDDLKTKYDKASEESHSHINDAVINKFTEDSAGNVLYDGKMIKSDNNGIVDTSDFMKQSIYDSDNDGIIDICKTVDVSGQITGTLQYYGVGNNDPELKLRPFPIGTSSGKIETLNIDKLTKGIPVTVDFIREVPDLNCVIQVYKEEKGQTNVTQCLESYTSYSSINNTNNIICDKTNGVTIRDTYEYSIKLNEDNCFESEIISGFKNIKELEAIVEDN